MLADRIQPFTESTIFYSIKQWVQQTKATDIATGQPNWKMPQFIKENFKQQLENEDLIQDQYGPPQGILELRESLAKHYNKELNQEYLKAEDFHIGVGASQIINDVNFAFLNQGDEVIVFDPHFPQQRISPLFFGAKVVSVKQKYNQEKKKWEIDINEFKNKINEKTKLVVTCSPNNPTGKVFTKQEYQQLGEILEKYQKVIVMADDVYDYLVYDKAEYVRFFQACPQLSNRIITVGSLGKKFSCTGWRYGFAFSKNPELIKGLFTVGENSYYGTFKPGQYVMAKSLEQIYEPYKGSNSFLDYTCQEFQKNRDFIMENFSQIPGFDWQILGCEGGYFVLVDIKKMIPKILLKYFYKKENQGKIQEDKLNQPCACKFEELEDPDFSPDTAFCQYLIFEYNVVIMPTSSFYVNPDKDNCLMRISLSKKLDFYKEALQKLQKNQ
ncbi:Pyridoxal phosphate-dependent transferase [Pseudocohnilembus persalinus]|uniref:Pyridoxal phosphate-dependent transferase n=1 Tax=Pseudocohnilembus persalinus TaxID=266149 RepID=A0A0V0Q8E7_PSEPJ|nr:Pyridoxal phosphate-dependent transferase [Pseudocohnilembus persalinus]|eukprot:KRW98509.1 Pyridoxal phosphate-dependent transferase [Pseudocohnilembus persalinus]